MLQLTRSGSESGKLDSELRTLRTLVHRLASEAPDSAAGAEALAQVEESIDRLDQIGATSEERSGLWREILLILSRAGITALLTKALEKGLGGHSG